MAGSPNVAQGTINRLKASVIIDGFPQLNITPSFLLPEGIGLSFGGPITTNLPSMTGVVTSPEPYQLVTCTVHLIKSQPLAAAYKAQIEASSLIGSYTIRPDVDVAIGPGPWNITNGTIINVSPLNFGGRDAGYVVELAGTYNINAAAWA